jgi:hypothetical protein
MNVNQEQASVGVSGIEDIKPESLNYKSMKRSLVKGERRTIKLQPANNVNQYTYENNRIIEFNLPAVGFIDNKNTTLVFSARSIDPGEVPPLNIFCNGIESVFNKVEVNLGDGSKNVENLQNYNYNANSLYKYKVTPNTSDYIDNQVNFFADRDIDNSASNTYDQQLKAQAYQYSVPLMGCGLLSETQEYLPCGVMAKSMSNSSEGYNKSFTIRIYLEDPKKCMFKSKSTEEVDGERVFEDPADFSVNPLKYEVNNVYLQMELIDCPEYEAELVRKVKSGNLVMSVPMKTSDLFVQQIPRNNIGQLSLFFNTYRKFLTGARVIFLPTENTSDPDVFQKVDLINTWTRPGQETNDRIGLENYQFKIGTRYYPTQPAEVDPTVLQNVEVDIQLTGSLLNELSKYLNITKQWDIGYDADGSRIENFMIGQTFQTFYDNQLYMNDGEMFLDGIDTTTTSQIVLNIQKNRFEGTDNTTVLAFLEYIQVLVIDKNGVRLIR